LSWVNKHEMYSIANS